MMAIQNGGTPTLAQQLDAFTGAASEDGKTTSVQRGAAYSSPASREDGGEENDGGEPQDEGQGNTQTDPPARKRESAQDRIDKAVRRQREAERRADEATGRYTALEERLAKIEKGGLTNQTNAQDIVDPNAPDPRKYQFGELDKGFIKDLARYEAQKIIEADNAAKGKVARDAETVARQRQVAEFMDKASEKYPDFREVVYEDSTLPVPQVVAELALESEFGADIAYAFAQDRKEAERIFRLTPAQQARWFGTQEAKFSALSAANGGDDGQQRETTRSQRSTFTQPARTTQAPLPPERRVRAGGNTQPVSPETQDFAAFEALARSNRRTN